MSASWEQMALFGVDQTDVDALRQGRLSERQQRGLNRGNVIGAVVMMALLAGLGLSIVAQGRGQPWAIGLSCIAVVIIAAMIVGSMFGSFEDASLGTVERATGIIRGKQWESEGDSYLYLEGQRYVLNRRSAFDTFVEGRRYTIYYRPGTRTIIYAEPG